MAKQPSDKKTENAANAMEEAKGKDETSKSATNNGESDGAATIAPVTNITSAINPFTTTSNNATVLDSKYFYEDEIYRVNRGGNVRFGLVVETPETYSGDEEDDDDDLKPGNVRVAWYPTGNETVSPENRLGLADRTLMPGDIVRRLLPGKDTQRGYCREVKVRADVQVLGTKYIIKNVDAKRIRPVTQFLHDGAVCLDSWVGSIRDVDEKAILRSSSGARIEVLSSEFYLFKEPKLNSYQNHIFYPGNVVAARLSDIAGLKNLSPEFHVPTSKKGNTKFTVESLTTEALWVQWQCKALSDETNNASSNLQQPSSTVTGDDLKKLKRINLFDACMLQLNDRGYLIFSENDTVVERKVWKKEITQTYKELWKEQKRQEKALNEAGNVSVPMSNTNVFDKLKKKFNLPTDNERGGKSKKNALKAVEKNKSKLSNLDSSSKSQPAHFESDSDWVSEDADTEDDDNAAKEQEVHVININAKANAEVKTPTTASPNGGNSTAASTPSCSPKHVIARLPYNKKRFRNLRKRSNTSIHKDLTFQPSEQVIAEAILVHSTATVVWQDGTIEENIPSINLYPIHHLDNHEFFPGDYVTSAREDKKSSFHEYGVVQKVDHVGRTAFVKWFTTYTNNENPTPTYNGEEEVSVYDLKDHPDFQYRAGTMVIRVANFVGEDSKCTAGQVIESLTEGRLKVWWVEGHTSLCWPQDLFEVGQYDQPSDEEDEDEDDDSDNSWETESETSEIGTETPKALDAEIRFLTYIKRARSYVERLQYLFQKDNEMECILIMRKLIILYKSCRNLDHLMNTNFFTEGSFLGLIGRVRKVNGQLWTERNKDQKLRLIKEPQSPTVVIELSPNLQGVSTDSTVAKPSSTSNNKDFSPKVVFSTASTPFKPSKAASSYIESGDFQSLQKRQLLEMARDALNRSSEMLKDIVVNMTAEEDDIEENSSEKKPNDKETSEKNATEKEVSETATDKDTSENPQQPPATPTTPSSIETPNNTETPVSAGSTTTASVHTTPTGTKAITSPNSGTTVTVATSAKKSKSYSEKNQLINAAVLNLDKAAEKSCFLVKQQPTNSPQEDSGNFSRLENCDSSSGSCGSPTDAAATAATKANSSESPTAKSKSESDAEAAGIGKVNSNAMLQEDLHSAGLLCAKFCEILKEQLGKCAEAAREKYVSAENWPESDKENNADDEEEDTTSQSEVVKITTRSMTKTVPPPSRSSEGDDDARSVTYDAIHDELNSVEVEQSLKTDLEAVSSMGLIPTAPPDCFEISPTAPKNHKFYGNIVNVKNSKSFMRAVMREHKLLQTSVPPGVWVKAFENRMDLLTVLIAGPKKTPYEDCMFLFDFQLGSDYPNSPPVCHYVSFCSERLNPNLYEDGKVCVSLLGTWSGRDNEVWTSKSTLLQVIVSIQGLILVPDPYFNEAGYEKQKGTQQGKENARMYNEMVVIKVVQATTKMLLNPPALFKDIIEQHYLQNGMTMHDRIKGYMELSKIAINMPSSSAGAAALAPLEFKAKNYAMPEFPLIPASRGFCLTLAGVLKNLYDTLDKFLDEKGPKVVNKSSSTHLNVGTQTDTKGKQQPKVDTATTAPSTPEDKQASV